MSRTLAKTLVALAGVALFAAAVLIYDALGLKSDGWSGGLYFIIAMALSLPFALGWVYSRFDLKPVCSSPNWWNALKVILGCAAFIVVGLLAVRYGVITDGKGDAKLYMGGALLIASTFALPLLTTRSNT